MNYARIVLVASIALLSTTPCLAADYHVGPSQPIVAVGDVPWESLEPGDHVFIHWRAEPYREKWVIARQGTEADPIVVSGVPNSAGELPVIDGSDATTRTELSFWNEVRGVIKIGGSSVPPATMPRHIIIENLEIRSARPPYTFVDDSGQTQTYANNAASIYVEYGEFLTFRNCVVHDSGNGIFIGSGDVDVTRDVMIESCFIHSNGIVGSAFEHNTYTEALGITYQLNRFGPLRAGADGNNLKDRSAGLIVRYNWIESGNRQLDLVDSDNAPIIDDPSYDETFVYGNILIEPDGAGNSQIVHYGGDSGDTASYRQGTLYFHHNTLVSTRSGNTTLFRISIDGTSADARNNILYVTAAGFRLGLTNEAGDLRVSHNLAKPGWVATHASLTGSIDDDGSWIETADPGFVDLGGQDFHLAAGSAAIDATTALHPATLPDHAVTLEYVPHRTERPRSPIGSAFDLGAFELVSANEFVRGDCNDDGANDIADVVGNLESLFGISALPACSDACDVNDDGTLDIADPVHQLAGLFSGGPAPLTPYPGCGVDPTADGLGCSAAVCP